MTSRYDRYAKWVKDITDYYRGKEPDGTDRVPGYDGTGCVYYEGPYGDQDGVARCAVGAWAHMQGVSDDDLCKWGSKEVARLAVEGDLERFNLDDDDVSFLVGLQSVHDVEADRFYVDKTADEGYEDGVHGRNNYFMDGASETVADAIDKWWRENRGYYERMTQS